MEEIFIRIESYQKAMGYNFKLMSIEERMQAFRNYMVALQIEQAELAQELPIKPWRPIADQKYARADVIAEEFVDCLFFLFDQALVLGLSKEQIREAFELKMTKNLSRIKDGYNLKQGDEQTV